MVRKIFEFFDLETTRTLILMLVPTSIILTIIGICSNGNESVRYEMADNNITYIPVPEENVKLAEEFENIKMEVTKNNNKKNYKMSPRAHEFIKSFEKCKLTAYHIKGEKYNTIGWGHYLDEKHERNIKNITQKRADELFCQDVAWVDQAVTDMLNDVNPDYKWSQGIVDGLGSLVYNCGEHGVRTTEFYRRLQNCRFHNGVINESDINYTLAIVKKTRCTKPGHYKRRIGEYQMMIES